MKKKDKEIWVAALRSGDFEQGIGALCRNGKYCCLGVAYDVLIDGDWIQKKDGDWAIPIPRTDTGDHGFLPHHIREKIGISEDMMIDLAHMNDCRQPFKYIASYIEMNIEAA